MTPNTVTTSEDKAAFRKIAEELRDSVKLLKQSRQLVDKFDNDIEVAVDYYPSTEYELWYTKMVKAATPEQKADKTKKEVGKDDYTRDGLYLLQNRTRAMIEGIFELQESKSTTESSQRTETMASRAVNPSEVENQKDKFLGLSSGTATPIKIGKHHRDICKTILTGPKTEFTKPAHPASRNRSRSNIDVALKVPLFRNFADLHEEAEADLMIWKQVDLAELARSGFHGISNWPLLLDKNRRVINEESESKDDSGDPIIRDPESDKDNKDDKKVKGRTTPLIIKSLLAHHNHIYQHQRFFPVNEVLEEAKEFEPIYHWYYVASKYLGVFSCTAPAVLAACLFATTQAATGIHDAMADAPLVRRNRKTPVLGFTVRSHSQYYSKEDHIWAHIISPLTIIDSFVMADRKLGFQSFDLLDTETTIRFIREFFNLVILKHPIGDWFSRPFILATELLCVRLQNKPFTMKHLENLWKLQRWPLDSNYKQQMSCVFGELEKRKVLYEDFAWASATT